MMGKIVLRFILSMMPFLALPCYGDVQVQGYLNKAALENLSTDPTCAPASTCPDGRIYWNTVANEPRMWDGSAWQEILIGTSTVPNPLLLDDGSSGAPARSYTLDTNLGHYRRSEDVEGHAGSYTLDSNTLGQGTVSQSAKHLRLIAGGMNTGSAITPGLWFGSDDSDLSCPDSGCALVGMVGRAAETFGSPAAGDMHLDTYVKNNSPGNNDTYTLATRVYRTGQFTGFQGISSGDGSSSQAIKWYVYSSTSTSTGNRDISVPGASVILGATGSYRAVGTSCAGPGTQVYAFSGVVSQTPSGLSQNSLPIVYFRQRTGDTTPTIPSASSVDTSTVRMHVKTGTEEACGASWNSMQIKVVVYYQ